MNVSWKSEISAISQLVAHRNDFLEVKNEHLHVTKGSRSRAASLSLMVQPLRVAEHLDQLIDLSGRFQLNILNTNARKAPAQYYEQVTQFRREAKMLREIIPHLGASLSKKEDKARYVQLYNLAYGLYEDIRTLKKELPQPIERPVEHVQYDEWMSPKLKHPKRVPLQETVAAAKEALERSQLKISKRKRIAKTVAKIALLAIPLMITSLIHPIKEFIWNPIERLICGGVRTESPFTRLNEIAFPVNQHKRNFKQLSRLILLRPVIGQEEVDAILPLLPYLKKVELWSAHLKLEDPELEKGNLQQIDLGNLDKVLDAAAASPRCKTIELSNEIVTLPGRREWLANHGFKKKGLGNNFTRA